MDNYPIITITVREEGIAPLIEYTRKIDHAVLDKMDRDGHDAFKFQWTCFTQEAAKGVFTYPNDGFVIEKANVTALQKIDPAYK